MPADVIDVTNSKRVPAATATDSPLVVPDEMLPRLTVPDNAGDRLTEAPLTGENTLLPAAAERAGLPQRETERTITSAFRARAA